MSIAFSCGVVLKTEVVACDAPEHHALHPLEVEQAVVLGLRERGKQRLSRVLAEHRDKAPEADDRRSWTSFLELLEVSGKLRLDDADDTQTHYFNLFHSDALLRFTGKLQDCFVAEYRKDRSEMAIRRFLQSSRWFAELGWRAPIAQETVEDSDNKGAPGLVR